MQLCWVNVLYALMRLHGSCSFCLILPHDGATVNLHDLIAPHPVSESQILSPSKTDTIVELRFVLYQEVYGF